MTDRSRRGSPSPASSPRGARLGRRRAGRQPRRPTATPARAPRGTLPRHRGPLGYEAASELVERALARLLPTAAWI